MRISRQGCCTWVSGECCSYTLVESRYAVVARCFRATGASVERLSQPRCSKSSDQKHRLAGLDTGGQSDRRNDDSLYILKRHAFEVPTVGTRCSPD